MTFYIRKVTYLAVLIVFNLCITGACEDTSQPAPEASLAGSSRLSELLGSGRSAGFASATEARTFTFPADHGPHPEFRNEWWYLTGNLDDRHGRRFGFELTLFRFTLSPLQHNANEFGWQTNQVYVGHFAITDVSAAKFHVAQRYSRGSMGLAGAAAEPFRVWLNDWYVRSDGTEADGRPLWFLHAADQGIALDLQLEPGKPVVLNGIDGLSRKSAEPGNATYYYSLSRLQSSGTLTIDADTYDVSGLAWLDREWGSSALSEQQRGWDWFALQLSDGSDLMFYMLRSNDGAPDRFSAGTWIDPAGNARHLTLDDVEIEVTDFWESHLGGRYPSGWNVRIAAEDLNLRIKPVLDQQELSTNVRYWEGAVDVRGHVNGRPLTGRGYVELTGYADN